MKLFVSQLPVVIVVIVVVLMLTVVSAIPWKFTCLEIGRLIGPIPFLDSLIFSPLVIIIVSISFLIPIKLMKQNRITATFILSLAISLLVIFSFSLVFMPQVSQAGKKIDTFVIENANLSFQDYVTNVSSFLNKNVGAAYGKPEAFFKIDFWICNTLLDPYIMQIWEVTRGDLIVYQRWGTCEQAALLIGELLQRNGYETRQAFFKNIDHSWVEVKYNGTWLIVDPWYIDNFVEAQDLKNIKPAFQQASGVEVQYSNGTRVDASNEHGY